MNKVADEAVAENVPSADLLPFGSGQCPVEVVTRFVGRNTAFLQLGFADARDPVILREGERALGFFA